MGKSESGLLVSNHDEGCLVYEVRTISWLEDMLVLTRIGSTPGGRKGEDRY